jgi:hypothetical protein
MVPADTPDQVIDPTALLTETIEHAWITICETYDATACLPNMQTLFEGADLSNPKGAAESVVASMLLEVVESIGRFSPWYKMPARAFGLASVRDSQTNRVLWMLAPEASQKWGEILEPLTTVIRNYSGLIQAILLVDDLMRDIPGDPCVPANCGCLPPHTIQIRQSVLDKTEIICESCKQAYT